MIDDDPVQTNPEQYRILWENELVRVLEYRDAPGTKTTPHRHPNSVMVTLSSFDRRLSAGGRDVDVSLPAGQAVWLAAQMHAGENTGTTSTHTIFVELKGSPAGEPVAYYSGSRELMGAARGLGCSAERREQELLSSASAHL